MLGKQLSSWVFPYLQACEVFHSRHPTTISMSVLVVVEMFNALNNLSEDASLLRVGLVTLHGACCSRVAEGPVCFTRYLVMQPDR
jgi:hypothetical protein